MNLDFLRGDPARPRGHALLFFHADEPKVLATYVVVPPIALNLAKYMPPMLAGRLPIDELQSAAVPLPPIPEELPNQAEVERLAALRDDDLIDGGRAADDDPMSLMQLAASFAQRYYESYRHYLASEPAPEPAAPDAGAVDVSEILYQFMGESDKVAELAKLAGKLRYAVEGADSALVAETTAEVERLGRHLPQSYQIARFLAAAARSGEQGGRLAQLYVERFYALARQDFEGLATADRAIAAAEATGS